MAQELNGKKVAILVENGFEQEDIPAFNRKMIEEFAEGRLTR